MISSFPCRTLHTLLSLKSKILFYTFNKNNHGQSFSAFFNNFIMKEFKLKYLLRKIALKLRGGTVEKRLKVGENNGEKPSKTIYIDTSKTVLKRRF